MYPAAETKRLNRQQQVLHEQVGFDVNAESVHVAQRDGQVFIEESVFDPALYTSRAIKIPVVDKCGTKAGGLRKQEHQAVDVLLREIDDGHKQRTSGKVRD